MCLFFGMWFASGALMLFIPFPALSDHRRLAAMPTIDTAAIKLTPTQAVVVAKGGKQELQALRLIEGPGGPVYLVRFSTGVYIPVSATTGLILPGLSVPEAKQQAQRLVKSNVQSVIGPYTDDQWTVTEKFNPYRPFYRVDLDDSSASHVYISERTGEALQITTRLQRITNYAGSIIHWIYPTILRRYPTVWSYTVWTLSLVGIATAVAGIILGCYRSWSSLRNKRRPGISPFRKLFRLHHMLGLGAGFFLLTWIVSGWLSVDHGILFPTGKPTIAELAAYRGEQLESAVGRIKLAYLILGRGKTSLEVNAVHGRTVLTRYAFTTGEVTTRLLEGNSWTDLSMTVLLQAAQSAWPSSHPVAATITAQDDYAHLLYDGLPTDALRIKLGDAAHTWVHVSAATGQIIDVQDWRRRLYRWLFNGLHTFDLPGLSTHDLIRKLIMLPLLAAGLALSITGIILAQRRITR